MQKLCNYAAQNGHKEGAETLVGIANQTDYQSLSENALCQNVQKILCEGHLLNQDHILHKRLPNYFHLEAQNLKYNLLCQNT